MSNPNFGEVSSIYRPTHITVFQLCTARHGHEPAMNVEIAPVINRSPDYQRKFSIQLSVKEMGIFCLILKGDLAQGQFEYHGDNRNNALYVNWQTHQPDVLGFIFCQANEKLGESYLSKHELLKAFILTRKSLTSYYGVHPDEMYKILTEFYLKQN